MLGVNCCRQFVLLESSLKSNQLLFIVTGLIVFAGLGMVVFDLWDDFVGKSLSELWANGYLMVVGLALFPLVIGAFLLTPVIRSVFPNEVKDGVVAQAKVLKVWDTNMTLNTSPQVGLLLEIPVANGTAIEVKTKVFVSRTDLALLRPGSYAEVRYDPRKPQRFYILKLSFGLPTDSSVVRMEELEQLLERGLISADEYCQKREEVLRRL
jgi:hypothetical protein